MLRRHSSFIIHHSSFSLNPEPRIPLHPLALVACVARNGVIGHAGTLPWHLPADLQRFKTLTLGHCLIMGRVTYESLPGALPGRHVIVVSRTAAFSGPEVETARTFDDALDRAWARDPLPFVAGGVQIYAQALPRVTVMYLTELEKDVDGDVHFPAWDPRAWREAARATAPGMTFRTLARDVGSTATGAP